jgi:hypothetical protein
MKTLFYHTSSGKGLVSGPTQGGGGGCHADPKKALPEIFWGRKDSICSALHVCFLQLCFHSRFQHLAFLSARV